MTRNYRRIVIFQLYSGKSDSCIKHYIEIKKIKNKFKNKLPDKINMDLQINTVSSQRKPKLQHNLQTPAITCVNAHTFLKENNNNNNKHKNMENT